MDASQTDRCGYVWPENLHDRTYLDHQNCCYRRTLPDSNQCAWHTDADVSINQLEEVGVSQEIRKRSSTVNELIDGANLSGQNLEGFSLDHVSLRDANFSQANLRFASLSESDLRGADFAGAVFQETSFIKSDLRFAKLPDSDDWTIARGDFTGADLREIDFPNDLRYSRFERAFIFEHPIDFDPELGVQDSNDILAAEDITETSDNLLSKDYFGPPTYELGRRVCMEYWPNINVGKVLNGFGWTADFSERNLVAANLSGAHLWHADFSGAFLEDSDLSDAVLWMADFSRANLRNANLSGADLRNANLTGADLRDADLTGADLRRTDISDLSINGGTKCSRLYENPGLSHDEWSALSRAHHDLKNVFGENGLIGNARNHHALQRRSRGLEAKSRDGWTSPAYYYFGGWAQLPC